jgi:aconitate hydratase
MDVDIASDAIGDDREGKPVYLRDIWPSPAEIEQTVRAAVKTQMYSKEYGEVFHGDDRWRSLPVPEGNLYDWNAESTYIARPPFFDGMPKAPAPPAEIRNARVLAVLGNSVTTDHISPAGSIQPDGPAGRYLISRGVRPVDFNSYGARRGNHEVMVRGTLANIRLRNLLAPGTEGGWTTHIPSGEKLFIYDASIRYQREGTPLLIIAGKEYGSGSSRDWAAKGTLLLGVKAVIAESFERIHRSNLVGMGVLPMQFLPGESRETLGLTGFERYSISGIADAIASGARARVKAATGQGVEKTFEAVVRIDTPMEAAYFRNGGILPYVVRQLAAQS